MRMIFRSTFAKILENFFLYLYSHAYSIAFTDYNAIYQLQALRLPIQLC